MLISSYSIACVASADVLNGPVVIVIAGNEGKGPKIYRDAQGHSKGMLVDILRYLEAKLGATFQIDLQSWARAYHLSLAGKNRLVGLSKNSERLAMFDCSDVIYTEKVLMIVLKGEGISL